MKAERKHEVYMENNLVWEILLFIPMNKLLQVLVGQIFSRHDYPI